MKTNTIYKTINYVLLVLIAANLSACGMSTGWEVKFGTYPITQITDTRGTSPENYEKIKRVDYSLNK